MSIEAALSPEPESFATTGNCATDNPVRLHGTPAVAAAVPYLLGFVPVDSLVIVCLNATTKSVVVTMRVDLLDGLKADAPATPYYRQLAAKAIDAGADAAILLAHTDHRPACPTDDDCLLGQAERAFSQRGMVIVGSGCVRDRCWIPHSSYGHADGTAIPLGSGDGLAAECDLVIAGIGHLPSREDLERKVHGPPDRTMVTVASYVARHREADHQLLPASPRETRRRRRTEDAIVGYLSSPSVRGEPGPRPAARQLARWLLALSDCRIREPVLRRMLPSPVAIAKAGPDVTGPDVAGPDVTERMAWIVRQAPLAELAPAGACLAALAWQNGNGALAVIAADRALSCDQANVLADLVKRAVQAGMPPRAWVELMRSVPLRSLRSGMSPSSR